MTEIKLTLVNGHVINTLINGTEEEIINHYNDNNFLSCCSNDDNIKTNVKEIEIEVEPVALGCKKSTRIYVFKYDYKAKCYLY